MLFRFNLIHRPYCLYLGLCLEKMLLPSEFRHMECCLPCEEYAIIRYYYYMGRRKNQIELLPLHSILVSL